MAGILLINFCHFRKMWHSLRCIYGLWNLVFVNLLSWGQHHICLLLYLIKALANLLLNIMNCISRRKFVLLKINVHFHKFLLVRAEVLLIVFVTFIHFHGHILLFVLICIIAIEVKVAVVLDLAECIQYSWACLTLFVTCWCPLLLDSVDPSGSFIELHKCLASRVFDTKCLGRFANRNSVLLSQLYEEPSGISWDWVIVFSFVYILHIQNWSYFLIIK